MRYSLYEAQEKEVPYAMKYILSIRILQSNPFAFLKEQMYLL
ncbi:hypothetical protein QW060_25440 [Myroides ceti]|uniref:Uncharacterized protein n=1 Tax=Paenimyroides ceti TaxID=395087 RepID=A0ABT8D425_9FLAO|nr:hypothetical protein [Paenimyroides ceti]MDN3710215.1 hypothetical protein [Paenimyroides ceti]